MMLSKNLDQRPAEETRVVYHIDDEETPYLVKLNVPPTQVTLADFKNALNLPRINYKFFFKSMDDDFGVVKEEIVDEQARLPMFKGRVVSWLVSAEDSLVGSAESASQCTEILATRVQTVRKQLHQQQKLINHHHRPMNPLDLMYETSVSESDALSDDFDTCTEIDSTIGPTAKNSLRKLNAARLNRALTAHHNHSHHNHTGHDCRCDSSSVLTSDVDSTTFVDSDDDDDDDDYQTQEDDYEDLDDEFDRLTQISSTTEDTSVSKAAENREKRRKRMLIQAKLQQQQLHHNHHQQQQHAQAFGNGLNKLSVMGNGGRNKTKNPYAKLNRSLSRASSNSSITDSTMSLNIITVTLHLTSVNFLGISIVGQSYKNGDGGIYVGSIMSGGAVAADGRIDPGDMILQVNEVNFENLSNDKAVEVLREAVSKPGPIKLVIAKCCFPQSNAGAMNSMSGSSTIAGGITSADILAIKKDEPVRPIDPRAWVEHTKIAQGFTDPEYPPRPDSVSTMNSIATTVKEVNYNSIQLTTGMDMLFIARAMAATDSGLEVKDRMWLKITIPGAFLGSEVVDWLYNQVQGFVDRKEAKKYAAAMLKQNYIKHTVNKSSFSEQCYYTFGDLITVVPAMNGLNLNPSPNESTPFAPCVDTVHYGVFGAAPGHGSSDNGLLFEQKSMLNADNRSSLSHSNASIQFNHQMAQALSQPIPNHLDAQQMLLQSRQFINSINSNSLMPGNNNQILYSDTYQANASSSNSSETQSSLNTQSTRDTAIGVTSSNGNGSRATLQEMNVITSTLGTSQPPPVFFDDRFSSNEYAIDPIHSDSIGHENEVNNDDEQLIYG